MCPLNETREAWRPSPGHSPSQEQTKLIWLGAQAPSSASPLSLHGTDIVLADGLSRQYLGDRDEYHGRRLLNVCKIISQQFKVRPLSFFSFPF